MNKREMIQALQERRAEIRKNLDAILETVHAAKRTTLTDDEKTSFDNGETEIREIDARTRELDEQIVADEAAAQVAKRYAGVTSGTRVTDAPIYVKRGGNGHSYFRDLYISRQKGDRDALERLDRNNKMVADAKGEQRAISTTNSAGGKVFAAA